MMKTQKLFKILVVLGFLFQTESQAYAAIDLPNPVPSILPLEKSKAFESYQKRPQSELSKLLYLKDILQKSRYTVVYNGQSYSPKAIAALVTAYIGMNYRKEEAETWINKHAYRSLKGQIIYLRDSEGKMLILKDILLEELKFLPQ